MDLMYLLELAVNGGLAGLMYALVAMGIVLIYKSSSVPNLAQGGLTMLGADAYVQNLFYGGALVIAVSLSQLVRNRQPQDFS